MYLITIYGNVENDTRLRFKEIVIYTLTIVILCNILFVYLVTFMLLLITDKNCSTDYLEHLLFLNVCLIIMFNTSLTAN